MEEGDLPILRRGGRSGVTTDTPSDPAQRVSGGPGRGTCPLGPPGESHIYRFSFPKRLLRIHRPLEGCLGVASNGTNLQVHFAHRHVRDTLVVLEESNLP